MDFDHPPAEPVPVFENWLADAGERSGLPNHNAMCLATLGPGGVVSARIVLLKHFDRRGAVFFTSRNSGKGRDLATHPRAALVLHWDTLERQIRIEGPVEPVEDAESDRYFARRSWASQIGAWASEQSEPVASRAALEARVAEMEHRFGDGPVPRPPHWGGYRVGLQHLEFWQGRAHRVHDRVVYEAQADGSWSVTRLSP